MSSSPSKFVKIIYDDSTNELQLVPPNNIFNLNPDELRKRLANLKCLEIVDSETRSCPDWSCPDWSDVASSDSDDSSDEKEGKPSNDKSSSNSTQLKNEWKTADSIHDSKSSSVVDSPKNGNQRPSYCKTSTNDEIDALSNYGSVSSNYNNSNISKPEVSKFQGSNKVCSNLERQINDMKHSKAKLGQVSVSTSLKDNPKKINNECSRQKEMKQINNKEPLKIKSEDVSVSADIVSERLNNVLTFRKESDCVPEKQKNSEPMQKRTNHYSKRPPRKFVREKRANTPKDLDFKIGSASEMAPQSENNNSKRFPPNFFCGKSANIPKNLNLMNGSVSEVAPQCKYNNENGAHESRLVDSEFSQKKDATASKKWEKSNDFKDGLISKVTPKSKYNNNEKEAGSPGINDKICREFPLKKEKLSKHRKNSLKDKSNDFSDQEVGIIDRGSQCLSNLACVMLKKIMNQKYNQKKQQVGLCCKICSLSELNNLNFLSHFNESSDHWKRDNIHVASNYYCSICKLIICCEEMDSVKETEEHVASVLHTLMERKLLKLVPMQEKGIKLQQVDRLVLKKFKCTLMKFQLSTNSKPFLVPYGSSEGSDCEGEQIDDRELGVKRQADRKGPINEKLANIWVFPLKMNQDKYHNQNWVKFIGGPDTHRLYEHLLPMLSNTGGVEKCLIDDSSVAAYVLFKKKDDVQKLLKTHSESLRDHSLQLLQLGTMISKNELSLPIFDGSNYVKWSTKLMLVLRLHKCSNVVELDEKPTGYTVSEWALLDFKAQNIILRGLSVELVKKIIPETSAKKMLMKLDACYIQNAVNQVLCKNRLLELQMEEFENPLNFFSKFDKLINELVDAGEEINEFDKMNYLLLTIPRGLSSTIVIPYSTTVDQNTTDDIKAKVMEAYERKKNDTSSDLTNKLLSLNLSSFSNQRYQRDRDPSKFLSRSSLSRSDFQGTSSDFDQRNWRDDRYQLTGYRGRNSFNFRRFQGRSSYPRRDRSRGCTQNKFQTQNTSLNARRNKEENLRNSEEFKVKTADFTSFEELEPLLQSEPDTKGRFEGGGNDCRSLFGNEQRFMDMITLSVSSIVSELDSFEAQRKIISLKTSIAMAIESKYPNCVVYEFGSRVSGLSSSNSDYDLFVDLTGKMYWGTPNNLDEEQFKRDTIHDIEQVGEILKNHDEFTNILAILTARVPILRFTHVPTDCPCDLSFRNGLCVENTKIISKYLRMNLKIRWLIVAVKYWANVCGLGSSVNFTTYALTWMVLFYLMTKKLIPPVSCLMNLRNPNQRLIQGWKYETIDYVGEATISETEDKLLQGFFGYYAHFNFNESVVCPRNGSVVKKKIIAKCSKDQMPEEMKEYAQYIHQSSSPEKFDITECCVQDPFLLNHNITRQVRVKFLEKFKKYCDIANIELLLWTK